MERLELVCIRRDNKGGWPSYALGTTATGCGGSFSAACHAASILHTTRWVERLRSTLTGVSRSFGLVRETIRGVLAFQFEYQRQDHARDHGDGKTDFAVYRSGTWWRA
jgi:hypothetical protein